MLYTLHEEPASIVGFGRLNFYALIDSTRFVDIAPIVAATKVVRKYLRGRPSKIVLLRKMYMSHGHACDFRIRARFTVQIQRLFDL